MEAAAAAEAAAASTFAVEGIVKSRKRKGEEVEYLVDWEGYGEDDRTWEPEAAFADGGDEVLAAYRKRRRKEGKQKQKKQGGDNGGATAAAEESAVQVEEELVDDAAGVQKEKAKTCSVLGCIAYAVARGVCREHASVKRTNPPCCMPGCKTPSVKDMLCTKHGAHGVCKAPICLTMAFNASGLCCKHGARGFCSVEGCATAAVSKGLCGRHGGGNQQMCCMPGCKSLSMKDLLCRKHGAYGVCKAPTCLTMAANTSGRCKKHGARGFCSVDGCATAANSKGLCVQHGGGTRKLCDWDTGCTTFAVAQGRCKKHYAFGMCAHEECPTSALSANGYCSKHGGQRKKECSVPGCSSDARARGVCYKHREEVTC